MSIGGAKAPLFIQNDTKGRLPKILVLSAIVPIDADFRERSGWILSPLRLPFRHPGDGLGIRAVFSPRLENSLLGPLEFKHKREGGGNRDQTEYKNKSAHWKGVPFSARAASRTLCHNLIVTPIGCEAFKQFAGMDYWRSHRVWIGDTGANGRT